MYTYICRSSIDALVSEQQQAGAQKSAHAHAFTDLQRRGEALIRTVKEKENEIRQLNAAIGGFSSGGGVNQRASQFGQAVPTILQRMNSTRFSGEVLGPLGMSHIRMREGFEQYQPAVEASITRALTTFLVTNSGDQRLMGQILRDLGAGMNFNISVQQPCRRHNVPETSHGLSTIADCIAVGHDNVFNYLVDSLNIDQIYVAKDMTEVNTRLTRAEGRGRCFLDPSKMKRAILVNCDTFQYREGGENFTKFYGDYRCLLAQDMSAVIEHTKQELAQAQEEYAHADDERKDAVAAMNTKRAELSAVENRLKQIFSQLRDLNKHKSIYEAELSDIKLVEKIDTSDLEEEEQELKEALANADRLIDEKRLEKSSADKDLTVATKEKEQVEREKGKLEHALKQAEAKLNEYLDDYDSKRRQVRTSSIHLVHARIQSILYGITPVF